MSRRSRSSDAAVGDHVGDDVAVAIDVDLDVDLAEIGRIETDVELVLARRGSCW